MARKGLPKKYAKMGFKRGWAAYKRSKRSPIRSYAPKKRKVRTMARRRSYKKYYRKARTFGGGMKPVIDGLLVGAATGFLRGKIPYADPIATLGIGYFRNNATLKVLGGVELGEALLGNFFGGGNGGGVR
jgi:hypothetical protein